MEEGEFRWRWRKEAYHRDRRFGSGALHLVSDPTFELETPAGPLLLDLSISPYHSVNILKENRWAYISIEVAQGFILSDEINALVMERTKGRHTRLSLQYEAGTKKNTLHGAFIVHESTGKMYTVVRQFAEQMAIIVEGRLIVSDIRSGTSGHLPEAT